MQYYLNLFSVYTTYVILALSALFVLLFFWNIMLHRNIRIMRQRSQDFFAGNNVKNIEDIIIGHSKTLKIFDKDIQELYNISNQINQLAHKGIHKVGIVRFNPFKDIGGDQSFSIALLNGKKDGVVISSLYNTREGSRIYSKAILNGESDKYPLTEEEKEAIKIANSPEARKIN